VTGPRLFTWAWFRRRTREARRRAEVAEAVAQASADRWPEVHDLTDRFTRAAERSLAPKVRLQKRRPQ
jgi:hypothetical protein